MASAHMTVQVDVAGLDQFEALAERFKIWDQDWRDCVEAQAVELGKLKSENAQLRQSLLDHLLDDLAVAKLRIPDETIPVALAGAAIAATSSPRRFSRRRLLGLRG